MEPNIYIRSKNRPGCITSKVFNEEGIEHFIIVEPQDYERYNSVKLPTSKLLVLDQNDGGFDVVRHFALQKMREFGHPCWYVDDDINSAFQVLPIVRNKMPKTLSKTTFTKLIFSLEKDFGDAGLSLGAPVTQTWCCHNPMTGLNFKKNEYNMVYVNAALLPEVVFHENFPWRLEDAALATRARLSGAKVACHNDWAIGFPTPGVNSSGGAADFYAKKWKEGVDASRAYYEMLYDEYFQLLSDNLKKKFEGKKLFRTGNAKSKARKGIVDIWPNHKNIAILSDYLQESRK